MKWQRNVERKRINSIMLNFELLIKCVRNNFINEPQSSL